MTLGDVLVFLAGALVGAPLLVLLGLLLIAARLGTRSLLGRLAGRRR